MQQTSRQLEPDFVFNGRRGLLVLQQYSVFAVGMSMPCVSAPVFVRGSVVLLLSCLVLLVDAAANGLPGFLVVQQ